MPTWCFEPFPVSNRLQLFNHWIAYNQRLKTLAGAGPLLQWVDASFCTDKPNPGDIDLATFVAASVYEPAVDALIDFYTTFSLYPADLDAYVCPVYESGHDQYELYKERQRYWFNLFTSLRGEAGRKGFVQLTL